MKLVLAEVSSNPGALGACLQHLLVLEGSEGVDPVIVPLKSVIVVLLFLTPLFLRHQ